MTMTDKTRPEDLVPILRDAFARQIREALTGTPAHHALQLGDALCTLWIDAIRGLVIEGGPLRSIDHAAITRDWHAGLSADQIATRHGISRATAYNHHPDRVRKERHK